MGSNPVPPPQPLRATQVSDVMDALEANVNSVPYLANKVVWVYNDQDLIDMTKGLISYPAVGVVYDGCRSLPSAGPSGKVGVSNEAIFTLIVVQAGDAIKNTDEKKRKALAILDDLRGTMLGKRGPTNHWWHFLGEAPAKASNGMIFWVQRWSLPMQFMPQ